MSASSPPTPSDNPPATPKRSRLKTVLLALGGLFVVLIAGVLIAASTQPDTFAVQRSIVINAPAEQIFPMLNDFRESQKWSPYEELDPDMQRTLSDSPVGQGAVYEWDGDANVGAGRIEITDSVPNERVGLNLDMTRPFTCHNKVTYSLEPQGDGTKMTWAMEGPAHLLSKVVGVFCDMDVMVGAQFEQGLQKLKGMVESRGEAK